MLATLAARVDATVLRASFWTAFGFAGGQALRLANNLILTRLIMPEAFGVMAIVTIIITGLEMVTDVGLFTAVVQNRRGEDPAFINTAWTIKVVRSLVMAAAIALMAGPIADFYSEPALAAVLPYIALSVFVSGLSALSPSVAQRKLWLGRATLLMLLAQLMATVVSTAWALYSPTIWALVAGYLGNCAVTAVMSHALFPEWRARFAWAPEMAAEIFHFGKWMFLTSILVFAAGQVDRIVLAKLVPMEQVGLYSIAFMWASFPTLAAQTWCNRIIFPLASERLRETGQGISGLVLHRRVYVALFALGAGLFGGIFAPIFRLLYLPAYWPALGFFLVLLAGSVLRILDESYRVYNLASGRPQYTTAGSAAGLALFIAAALLLYPHYGATGIAGAFAVSQLASLAVAALGAVRAGLGDLRFDAAVLAASLVLMLGLHRLIG